MREILFRGQTRRRGEKVRMDGTPVESNWVYGGIFQGPERSVIYQYDPVEKFTVYSDTVGQYTGLTDKNGKRIWEGDVVRHEDGSTGYIIFLAQTMSYRLVLPETDIAIGHRGMGGGYNHAPMLEVIGTIYDNRLEGFK